MQSKFLVALFAIITSGCMMWDAGYTENGPVSRYDVPEVDQVPITYGISLCLDTPDLAGAPSEQSLSVKIENALKETGAFSSVGYGTSAGEDSYHIEFSFKQSMMDTREAAALVAICSYTLIPVYEIWMFDMTAILSIKGKPIYSTAKAEEMHCLIWLPTLPVGLVMNPWMVMHYIEDGMLNAMVNDIVKEHCRRYFPCAKPVVLQ